MNKRISGLRRAASLLAVAGLGTLYSNSALACAEAATSPTAAATAIAVAAKANADSANGVIACLAASMDTQDFRAAIAGASAQIGDQALAMLVVELGANHLFAQAGIIPDPIDENPGEGDPIASGS